MIARIINVRINKVSIRLVSLVDLYFFFSAFAVFLYSANFAVIKTFNLQEGFTEGWRLSIPFLFCLFSGIVFLLLVAVFDNEPLAAERHRVYLYLIIFALGWIVSALHNRAYMERRYGKKISIRLALLLNFQIIALMKVIGFVLWIPFILMGALIGII